MRTHARIWMGTLFVALSLGVAAPAHATPCTLLAVDKPDAAKLRVYFTKFVKEDTTDGKYKACKVVKKGEAGTLTFYVTPFRQDATDVVHASNWPN